MKKIFTYTMMMIMVAMTMTSCDEDAMLAYDMEGVWQGTIQGNFYYDRYRSNDYDTEISFVREGSHGGTGYEIDYNYTTRRYFRNYFNWTVSNGRIIMEYDDGATVIIHDYGRRCRHFLRHKFGAARARHRKRGIRTDR